MQQDGPVPALLGGAASSRSLCSLWNVGRGGPMAIGAAPEIGRAARLAD